MVRNATFFDPTRARNMAVGVSAPEKTKCRYCKKVKGSNQFSNKQLGELSKKIGGRANDGHLKNGLIVCKGCTSGQNTEMMCILCDETKPLEEFAKTHRRTRDEAKCKICMDKRINLQPDEPLREDSEEDDAEDSDDSNPWADGTTEDMTSSVNGRSLDGGERQTTTSMQTSEGGVWVAQNRSYGPASMASHPTTFDPNAYGASRRTNTTSNSNSGLGAARGSQATAPVKTSKGGWAKVPSSYKSPMPEELPSSSDEDDNWGKHQQEDDDSDDSGP